jgi:membrane protein DedA with SNARE-associated domain/membrane-associated phospholipid phosphatase
VATVGLAAGVTDRILSLPGWLVLVLVFAFPALEASAFLGFVFPGEIAVILGGVAASRGMVPLWAVIAAAVSGAIIGDSIGYLIGRRWGTHLLQGTVGRLPVIRTHLDKNLESARAYVQRRQGSAVFFGRFTAALRALVPGLAGLSDVHYPTFLAYNVAGGTLWGAGFAVLGYVAGASYHRVEKIAGQAGLILLGVIVAGLITSRLVRRFAARSPGLKAVGDRLAATPPLAWVRRRFPAQVAWGRRRLDAHSPRGFWLTFTVAAGALAAWAFGGLTQDVTGHDDTALADPHVTTWVVAHRTEWLTSALKVLTWLGSTAVIIPAGLAIGLYFLIRRRDWRPLAVLTAAVAGAVGLWLIIKPLVGRPRPPAAIWIGHYPGAAFPSGHATQSIAFYAMLAIVLGAGLSVRRRALLWSAAALVVLIVGASRIYLGAHWLTDVLAGYALGACWVAIVVAVLLITSSGTGRVRPVRERGQAPTPGHQNRQKPHSPASRPAKARYAATGPASGTAARRRAQPRVRRTSLTRRTAPRAAADVADRLGSTADHAHAWQGTEPNRHAAACQRWLVARMQPQSPGVRPLRGGRGDVRLLWVTELGRSSKDDVERFVERAPAASPCNVCFLGIGVWYLRR